MHLNTSLVGKTQPDGMIKYVHLEDIAIMIRIPTFLHGVLYYSFSLFVLLMVPFSYLFSPLSSSCTMRERGAADDGLLPVPEVLSVESISLLLSFKGWSAWVFPNAAWANRS